MPRPKTHFLAPRTQLREILDEDTARRMLQSGSWVAARPPSPNQNARYQRVYNANRRAQGMRKLQAWVPQEVYDRLQRLKAGRTLAQLIADLVEERKDCE